MPGRPDFNPSSHKRKKKPKEELPVELDDNCELAVPTPATLDQKGLPEELEKGGGPGEIEKKKSRPALGSTGGRDDTKKGPKRLSSPLTSQKPEKTAEEGRQT